MPSTELQNMTITEVSVLTELGAITNPQTTKITGSLTLASISLYGKETLDFDFTTKLYHKALQNHSSKRIGILYWCKQKPQGKKNDKNKKFQ